MKRFQSETEFNEWVNETKLRQALFTLLPVLAIFLMLTLLGWTFTSHTIGEILFVGSAAVAAYPVGLLLVWTTKAE